MTINSIGSSWTTAGSTNGYTAANSSSQSSGTDFQSALSSIILPNDANAKAMSASLADSLNSAFAQAGIPTNPPVELSVDLSNGRIKVSGNRSDTKQIEDLINNNPDLAKQVRDTNAICSQASAVERSLQFDMEYLASSDPKSVISKYSDLFGTQARHAYSLEFTGSGVEAQSDGKAAFTD